MSCLSTPLATRLVLWFCTAVSRLPLPLLYCFSDGVYLFLYHVVRYRRALVHRHLSSCFPEATPEERKRLEKRFYRWFCDYFVEALKLLTIGREELQRHLHFTNPEVVEQCLSEGQDVAAVLGHYANWEWLSCAGMALHPSRVTGLVYSPLHSPVADALFQRIRSSQPGALTVPKKKVLRTLVTLKREGRRSLFGYIADQAPKWQNIHLWLPFLHHDTPVFTGAERIARQLHQAVVYVEMSRPRRGYYTVTYHLITRQPEQLPEHEVTRRFFALLEQTIRRAPAYYLWTHNHWKRTHEEFDRRFEVVHGKVVERKEATEEGPTASQPQGNDD